LPKLLAGITSVLTVILPEVSELGNLAADFPQHRFIPSGYPSGNLDFPARREMDPTAPAYLLFTSGSTGEPKGVAISHSNVRSYVDFICDRYEVSEQDRFSQVFDLTFDLSVHDMFVCWERGACLFAVPDTSVMAPAKFIRDHQLTCWFSVPSTVGFLMKLKLLSPGSFPSLRLSLFCGEPLPSSYARAWQEAAPNSILENLYGPTESTIAISHYRWNGKTSPDQCLSGIVPIGLIFPEQRCRIVNSNGAAVSYGEIGELCLSGPQVASGYLDDPAKTSERFLRLPDAGEATWYRTGDMAKQDESGCLYYLGRTDQQVKIRGHRVELQEVEAALRKACGTELVVAIPRQSQEGGADAIIAFASGVEGFDEARVLAACAEMLPAYMVPRNVILREEFPLNFNGKIDRRILQSSLEANRQ
jgi:amino acid adenylation domain-containing protein